MGQSSHWWIFVMTALWSRGYENLFRRFLYPLYEQHLRRRDTLRQMDEIDSHDGWSAEVLRQYQLQRLRLLLVHARDQVPWYREQFRQCGLVPEDVTDPAQLSVLPVLTKSVVKDHYQDLIALNWRGRTFSKRTGGSTGEPFRFEMTRNDYQRRMAVMWRGYGRAGARMGRRTLYLWGADILPGNSLGAVKNRLYHALFQRRMLNSFEMNRDNLAEYENAIRRYRPEVIVAYVTPLYELARHLLAAGRTLPGAEAILTGAEPLRDAQREVIEKAFRAPVHNTYGCREVMLIASEAPGVQGMLVNADQLLVESVDQHGRAVAGEPGRLLLTDLHAEGMPLIRYANGDVVTVASTSTPGFPWPCLRSVEGRQLDLIRTPDGRMLPGEFFPHLLKDIQGVERFQVVQQRLDALSVRIVAGADYDHTAELLLTAMLRRHLGERMHISIEYVAEIPLTAAGKLRVTLSMLGEQ
jgi:phenylacetate-CoA ligase